MTRIRTFMASLAILASFSTMAAADPIKIALPVLSLESMPIFVAQENGYFKKHGVEVDVIVSRGGGEAMKAFIAKEVDIVGTGFPEVGLMRAKGVDVLLFFAQNARTPFSLIARKETGVKNVGDLKGKTIAVTSPGSLTANLARHFIQEAGLDPSKDVSLISVGGGGEILGALKSNRADAAMLFEPFVSIAQLDGSADVIVDVAAKLDAFSSAPLSTSQDFIDKNAKAADDLTAALREALQFIKSNHDGVYAIAAKKFPNAKPDVLKHALEHMYRVYSPNGKFTKANVEETQKISVSLKIMPTTYPYDDVVAKTARE